MTPIVRHGQPTPAKLSASPTRARPPLEFPVAQHLVIATDKQVYGWDREGTVSLFESTTSGIRAASQANDGSGILAVADSQVVILHDVKRGMERTYKLRGAGEQARLLEYANDSRVLYFTTTLEHAVQAYSLRDSKLLEPGTSHPSPPTVMATSVLSRFQISASETPPTIYLHNLTHKSRPITIVPRVSSSPVAVAAFHPDRSNLFLLGHKDGTLVGYDANRILRSVKSGDRGRGVTAGLGEIGHFKRLHAITRRPAEQAKHSDGSTSTVDRASVSIVAAAFIPGNDTRAITAGGDGKCRIVDFGSGGKIVKTWHCKGPVTDISVLPVKSSTKVASGDALRKPAAASRNGAPEKNMQPSCLIAVARVDGKVLIYDSMGLLLREQIIDSEGGHVVSVEWNDGSAQRPTSTESRLAPRKDAARRRSNSVPSILPHDEDFGGTVARRSIKGPVHRDLPPIQNAGYMDLFSPVKGPSPTPAPAQRSPMSRSHPRPRLRSSTFVDNTPESSPEQPERSSRLALKPLALDSAINSPSARVHKQETPTSPSPAGQEPVGKGAARRAYLSQNASVESSASSGNSAKILADLRRVQDNVGQKPSTLAYVASYLRSSPSGSLASHQSSPGSLSGGSVKKPSKFAPAISRLKSSPRSDAHEADDEGDIWVTSADETDSKGEQRIKRQSRKRPPAVSALRSQVDVPGPTNLEDDSDDSIGSRTVLPPSTSDSPRGPIEVSRYFPRMSSLGKVHDTPSRPRALGGSRGVRASRTPRAGRMSARVSKKLVATEGCSDAEDVQRHCPCTGGCCQTLGKEVEALKVQMRDQQEEIEALKSLVASLAR